MSKMAVIYWSQTGNTQAMAEAIAAGAQEAGADVTLTDVSKITADEALTYDYLALGCPSMGSEVLEEAEFEPFFTELERGLGGKNVALFGSYGWGDGQWMRDWEADAQANGVTLACESVICNEAPDDEANAALEALAKAIG